MKSQLKSNKIRSGCRDIWNAYMLRDAQFTDYDIPYCPTTANKIPDKIITWEEAKSIYKKHISKKENDFKEKSFVCFYLDDYKFDGAKGIWNNAKNALKILCHFDGVITPDFSTYQDFPEAIKIYNTYRMRSFGYWLGKNGIAVINNVRWGTSESFKYCFSGIPKNSIISIGTCGGSPRKLIDRKRFENGLNELVDKLNPHTIIVYGSANYTCFENLKQKNIDVIAYPSQTARAFEGINKNE